MHALTLPTILEARQIIVCSLWLLFTLYVKVDTTVFVPLSAISVFDFEKLVTSFLPIFQLKLEVGRLPYDIQDTLSGIVSSVLTSFVLNFGVKGFTEILITHLN